MATQFTYGGSITTYTITATGTYDIDATGAAGGSTGSAAGGAGALVSGDFLLTQGDVIEVLVGGAGVAATGVNGAGGGGGTFIYDLTTSTLLEAAGGGGGAGAATNAQGGAAQAGTSGGAGGGGGALGAPGGTGGAGGGANEFGAGGGGGFSGSGTNAVFPNNPTAFGGASFQVGGAGGAGGFDGTAGGFGGGGGGAQGYGGGGGGYSGGGGASVANNTQAGGGGGSYDAGIAGTQTITAGAHASGGGSASLAPIQGVAAGYTGTITTYRVVTTGDYAITAVGATGGSGDGVVAGGAGALVGGIFLLNAGDTIEMLVGGAGAPDTFQTGGGNDGAGGGGGSFVVDETTGQLLVAAGGGGGAGFGGFPYQPGGDAQAGTSGGSVTVNTYPYPSTAYGGSNGGGGSAPGGGGGGGGYSGNGGTSPVDFGQADLDGQGGSSFANGGAGGAGNQNQAPSGGFGGGGGGALAGGGGGGGGYSGGAGGYYGGPSGGGGGGSYDGGTDQTITAADNTAGNGSIVIAQVVCFCAGTRIAGAGIAVERLRVGDRVALHEGGSAPVRWVGHRRIDPGPHPDPHAVLPVRIAAGAIAEGVPVRDLLVSPDHALFIDGVLIPARMLLNGVSIRREEARGPVDYFHVELDRHAVLLAEGMPAESYLDTGNRGFFGRTGGAMALHPVVGDGAGRAAASCAPFATDAARVAPIWRRIAARAGVSAVVAGTGGCADLHLRIGARTVRASRSATGAYVFALPGAASGGTLVSRSGRPSDLSPWLDDRRRLGVRVSRLRLHGDTGGSDRALDDPALGAGWHAPERAGAALWRWTDGGASVCWPVGTRMLEVRAEAGDYGAIGEGLREAA